MSVLLILLSAITWVPQLLLFLFQSYLEGLTLVQRQPLDRQRDLHRQRGLDSAAGVAFAGDFGAGEVACGCAARRCSELFFIPSVFAAKLSTRCFRRAGATSIQSERVDGKCYGGTLWHV